MLLAIGYIVDIFSAFGNMPLSREGTSTLERVEKRANTRRMGSLEGIVAPVVVQIDVQYGTTYVQ